MLTGYYNVNQYKEIIVSLMSGTTRVHDILKFTFPNMPHISIVYLYILEGDSNID